MGQQIQTATQATELERSRNQFLTERIQAKDDQLNDYRSRLLAMGTKDKPSVRAEKREEFNRSTTRFSNASNKDLVLMGNRLADDILKLGKNTHDRIKAGNLNALQDAIFSYQTSYQADAIVLRDEMLSRLPVVHRENWADIMYQTPNNLFGLDDVATDLKRLAALLPVK
jgi:hypothetical protein